MVLPNNYLFQEKTVHKEKNKLKKKAACFHFIYLTPWADSNSSILIFTLAQNGSNCTVQAVFSNVTFQHIYSSNLKTVW